MAKKKATTAVQEPIKSQMGDIIAICVTPKPNETADENAARRTAVLQVAEAIRQTNVYETIDVVNIKDVDLNAPLIYAEKDGDKEMREYVSTGEGKVTMALVMNQYKRDRDRGDIEEKDRFIAMGEEAIKTEDEARRKHLREVILEANNAADKRRAEAVLHAFDVANRWSTAPELTPRERVHGATRELYHHYGPTQARDEHGRFVHVEAGPEYDAHYEAHFAEDIKFRSIRAAKDLFGGK
jgi:hypothetical protein